MSFEAFTEYTNNKPLFEALVHAFRMGGSNFKTNFGKLLMAYEGNMDELQTFDDKKVLELALRQNWASAIKQLVADGDKVVAAVRKAR